MYTWRTTILKCLVCSRLAVGERSQGTRGKPIRKQASQCGLGRHVQSDGGGDRHNVTVVVRAVLVYQAREF